VHRGLDTDLWHQHAWLNRLQSLILLGFMGGFLALLGWLLWGGDGILMLLLAGGIGISLHPMISPHWVMRLYGASQIGRGQAPELLALAQDLSSRAGLARVPRLYYIPSSILNAFAVGAPGDSAIALSDGLLRRLDWRELAGVLAHEISHVRNRDLWVMGLADMFSRATTILSWLGQLLLLLNLPLVLVGAATINWFAILLLISAPTLSALAQLALSRSREYDADLNAARLTGDPAGLARALNKIEQIQGGWLERIFLPGRQIPDPSLLRTHPKTSDRVARLLALQSQSRPDGGPEVGGSSTMPHGDWGNPVRRRPRWHLNGLWH